MATDEVPKIQGASVSRTTTFMKFHNVMYCNLYTLQAIGGNDPSLSLVTVHVYVFHLIFFLSERERERIFIKINRNNDTIIIQCMDYTD